MIVFAEPVEQRIIKPGKQLTLFMRGEDYDYVTDNFKSNVDDGTCELSFNYISSNLNPIYSLKRNSLSTITLNVPNLNSETDVNFNINIKND